MFQTSMRVPINGSARVGMRYAVYPLIVFLAASSVCGCSREGTVTNGGVPNLPPIVWLSAAPPEGSVGTYTIHLYWGGWDPDGEISRFEYLVTNNEAGVFSPSDTIGGTWLSVFSNDSTFIFSADERVDSTATGQVSEFARSHTFFIRAVDEEGMRSVRPAHRSFTARTLSPEVSIEVPARGPTSPGRWSVADLPPVTTYRWKATDFDDDTLLPEEPESVQVALVSTVPFNGGFGLTIDHLRTPAADGEWQPWMYYRAPDDSGKFWTSPPVEFGTYVFAVRAKDEAGAVTAVLDDMNLRPVRISPAITGPRLTLANRYVGRKATTTCSTPVTIIDLPGGVLGEFTIAADASFYGGHVAGYRYGWDIADLDDPDQWEVDYTPFVGSEATLPNRSFFFGTHTLSTEVIDDRGSCSRIEIKVNVIQFTLERNVLIVDDFRPDERQGSFPGFENPTGRGILPNDAEHDAFWLDMVSNVSDFDPASDVLGVWPTATSEVSLALLARYKTIIWSLYGDVGQQSDFPLLYEFIRYRKQAVTAPGGKVQSDDLALAMAAGVHVMIAGNHPIQLVENRNYAEDVRHPLILKYELEGGQTGSGPDLNNPIGEESFGYKELCVDVIDYGYMNFTRRRYHQQTPLYYCPVQAYRRVDSNSLRDDTMRGANPLDPNFPPLELRDEVTQAGKAYQPSEKGLDAEVYNPAYFRIGQACQFVPSAPRPCFEPIYGLTCFDTQEPTYNQPVAFWTSAFADRVADAPGAIGARSVVFGFPPVFFKPEQVKPALEHIFFDEWQLPRREEPVASSRSR
jgi:hypothetical protein